MKDILKASIFVSLLIASFIFALVIIIAPGLYGVSLIEKDNNWGYVIIFSCLVFLLPLFSVCYATFISYLINKIEE